LELIGVRYFDEHRQRRKSDKPSKPVLVHNDPFVSEGEHLTSTSTLIKKVKGDAASHSVQISEKGESSSNHLGFQNDRPISRFCKTVEVTKATHRHFLDKKLCLTIAKKDIFNNLFPTVLA